MKKSLLKWWGVLLIAMLALSVSFVGCSDDDDDDSSGGGGSSTEEVQEEKYSLAGLEFKGGWYEWWGDKKILTNNASQTITFTAGPVDGVEHSAPTGNEFGIFHANKAIAWRLDDNTVLEDGTRTKMIYNSDPEAKGIANPHYEEDWEEGATYKAKIELTKDDKTAPELYITITKQE